MPMLKTRKELDTSVIEMDCIAIMKPNIKIPTGRVYFRAKVFERCCRILAFQLHILMIRTELQLAHPPARRCMHIRIRSGKHRKQIVHVP